MDIRDFATWSAHRVEVAVEKVVLELRMNGNSLGHFTVHQDGRIEPKPPVAGEAVLRAQAAALRGKLGEQLTMTWRDDEGWRVLAHNGHVVRVRREAVNSFLAIVDGVPQRWTISPDDIVFVQKMVERLVLDMPPRQ